jgi:aspartate/glutamate racemase
MTKLIGIVAACSPPGAELCYEASLTGAAAMGMDPEVNMHAHPFLDYMRHVGSNDWMRVADLMLSSAEKLAPAGACFLIAPCNSIHHAFERAKSCSSLPRLRIVICSMQNEGCEGAAICYTELARLFRETPTRLRLLDSIRILATTALRMVTC